MGRPLPNARADKALGVGLVMLVAVCLMVTAVGGALAHWAVAPVVVVVAVMAARSMRRDKRRRPPSRK
jgi:hypothetical protein